MSESMLTLRERLSGILESIEPIQQWSEGMTGVHDFMASPGRVVAFNACVTRLYAHINENIVVDVINNKLPALIDVVKQRLILKQTNK